MVIPSYLPITRINANDRNEAIKEYFNAGFQYAEILGFLFIINGVSLSLRQLKRILKALGLSRRKRPSEISNVVDAIEMELSGSGSCVGYRQIHQRLRDDYGLVVDRNTVRLVMGHLDPDGVLRRTRKRFIRRTYHCKVEVFTLVKHEVFCHSLYRPRTLILNCFLYVTIRWKTY